MGSGRRTVAAQSCAGSPPCHTMASCLTLQVLFASTVVVLGQQAPQYHIQTDQGADRFFRFQTASGQYRKEVRHKDGSQEGTYGWVDPNGVLRLFDYVADDLGYRIVQESLFNVGPASPDFSINTRGGDLNLGFEVYPLDGGAGPGGRLGPDPSLPPAQLHLVDGGDLHLTGGYRTNALVSSIPHEVHPNPLGKQIGATFFHELPVPPPPAPRLVIGSEAVAVPAPEERDSFVVGHTGEPAKPRAAPAPERSRIVIGLSHNNAAPAPRASRPRALPAPAAPSPAAKRRNTIVIGSSRRRRQLMAALHLL